MILSYYWDSTLVIILFSILIGMGSCCKPQCNKSIVHLEKEYCKPWFYAIDDDKDSKCTFMCRKINGIIRRKGNEEFPQLQLGYCMTYEKEKTYMIACPYDLTKDHIHKLKNQAIIMNTTLGELNNFTCSQLNRHGRHCHKCDPQHGQSMYTLDLSCYHCSNKYSGWLLYFALELGSLSIFIIIILVLRISPTKPNMKSFVLFCQLTTMFLSLASEVPYKHTLGNKTVYFIKIIRTCYGFWSLDFFRSVIPPFCVASDINNLEVLTFHYLSVIYPTLLIALAWGVVDLHERDFRPIVRMWRPFRRFLSHYPVISNPKRTIINLLATFVVLSYSKVIFITAQIVNLVHENRLCNHTSRLYLQPDINYFSLQHIPFVFLSTIMLVLFVIAPIALLLFYPIQRFQDKLNSFCVRSNNIQMFVEAFYGCYTDGTNQTKDRRFFSTIYLLFRIIAILTFVKAYSIVAYVILAVLHGVTLGILCVLKPYKQSGYHYLDSLFLAGFGVSSLFSAVATTYPEKSLKTLLFLIIYTVMGLPLVYASVCVFLVFLKWLRLIDVCSIIHKRRRGYAEIIEYASETIDSEEHQDKRTGQNDSIQTE